MNIYATYPCPHKCATILDDQRLIKLIMENVQMLCTTAYIYGKWHAGFCKPTHENHPCTLWTAYGRFNFEWLWENAWAMDTERRARWGSKGNGKVHALLNKAHKAKIWEVRKVLPLQGSSNVNCARHKDLGIDFTHIPNVHSAYRKYLVARWRYQQEHYPKTQLPQATVWGLIHEPSIRQVNRSV